MQTKHNHFEGELNAGTDLGTFTPLFGLNAYTSNEKKMAYFHAGSLLGGYFVRGVKRCAKLNNIYVC